MAKSEKEMSYKQIEEAVIRLSPKQLRELERKIWALQMDKLVTKMRRNMWKNKIYTARDKQALRRGTTGDV